jgi:signal transduction histidine kinase
MLAHELLNNLCVIVGRCDLLGDLGQPDDERTRHLQAIRETAKSMADRLNHHQCHLASIARTVAKETFIE